MRPERGPAPPRLLPEGLRRNWLILFPQGLRRLFEAELCPVPGWVTGDLRLECDMGGWGGAHREGECQGWRQGLGLCWQRREFVLLILEPE